jgi:hypothetical protein
MSGRNKLAPKVLCTERAFRNDLNSVQVSSPQIRRFRRIHRPRLEILLSNLKLYSSIPVSVGLLVRRDFQKCIPAARSEKAMKTRYTLKARVCV